ncbi:ZIP family metal transporter [Haloferacaceae archaeon DSL9]
MTARRLDPTSLPRWILAIGPLVVLLGALGTLFLTSPFGDAAALADAGTAEILWTLAVIGFFAGVAPVAIGMLWFPFLKSLDDRWIHAVLALSAGILTFVGVEMAAELSAFVAAVPSAYVGEAVALVALVGTFALMHAVSVWRHRTVDDSRETGLQVAYLVAIALGLHSIGEGLAIGSAFVLGENVLLSLLVIGFLLHNVTEGPTVVSAVARNEDTPPLRHFAAFGLIAGGPVIIGGWIGTFLVSPLVAAAFFAVALGAIIQVIFEVTQLIRVDAGRLVTTTNTATFAIGIALMFVLEDLIVDGLLF